MFQKNSVLQRISAHVDAGPRYGLRWVKLSGLLRRQIVGRLFILRLGIGSKLANRITGYIVATLCGLTSGRLSKSLLAVLVRKRAGAPTIITLIANGAGPCKDSCAG